jgi:facilitated trehalose transporter
MLVIPWAFLLICVVPKRQLHLLQLAQLLCLNVLGSVPPSGAFVGSLCAGPLMQWMGRRRTLMLSSPLWVLGWCLVALAQTYEMMLFARILTGFCVGLVTPSAAVYVSSNVTDIYSVTVWYFISWCGYDIWNEIYMKVTHKLIFLLVYLRPLC